HPLRSTTKNEKRTHAFLQIAAPPIRQLPDRPSRGTMEPCGKTKPTAGELSAKSGSNPSEGDSYANAIGIGDVEWGSEGRQRKLQGKLRGLAGQFPVRHGLRERPGNEPRRADRRRPRGVLFDGLAAGLGKNGLNPQKVTTTAAVTIDKVGEGFKITKIKLTCEAAVPGADPKKFQEIATATKSGCPISQALSAVPIELDAKLVSV